MITLTLNAWKNTNGHVTFRDMVLMEVALEGKQVDTTRWLIWKISDIQEASIDIDFVI